MNLDKLIEDVGTCKCCQQKMLYNLVPTSHSLHSDNIALFNKEIKRTNGAKRWDFHFVAKCPYECSGFSTFPAEDPIKEWFVKGKDTMMIAKRSKRVDRVEIVNGKSRYIFGNKMSGHCYIYSLNDNRVGSRWNHIKSLEWVEWENIPPQFQILAETLLLL